ncbi:MAG: HDOD domain-containing protein, partial [Deltaproteobacteria bacterium]|nr:HDOD domain-containing protein [Deltaproteobacteria bacterium]
IRKRLDDGSYLEDRERLIADIQSDPALFLHCARSLLPFSETGLAGFEPLTELRRIDSLKLKSIFDISDRDISMHSLKEMNPKQAACLQYALLSAHTAGTIAKDAKVSPDLAFSSASLRQLGNQLISWNYPRIYSQAISTHRRNKTPLNLEFQKLLGITPTEINTKFATDWCMHPEIRHALASEVGAKADPLQTSSHLTLPKLCRVSELFAQVKDPVNYPEAAAKWEAVENQLSASLDMNGFAVATKKVETLVEIYAETSPAILHLPLAAKLLARRKADNHGRELMEKNTYVQQCPEHLQEKFLEVYALLEQSKLCLDAISLLLESVVPHMGFKRGCLFLLNQNNLELQPVLRIGDLPLSAYHTFLLNAGSDIAASMGSNVPIRRDALGVDGTLSSIVYGALNHPRYQGVLYLELMSEDEQSHPYHGLAYFHAVRLALNDCLGEGIFDRRSAR